MDDRAGFISIGVIGRDAWSLEIPFRADFIDSLGDALAGDREKALRALLKPLVDIWVEFHEEKESKRVFLRLVPPADEG